MPASSQIALILAALSGLGACRRLAEATRADDGPLIKVSRTELSLGEHVPPESEAAVVGSTKAPVRRGDSEFQKLVPCDDCPVVFKDEEGTRSDRLMTPRLKQRLLRLAELVKKTWPAVQLRVTEAWDEDHEHGAESLHYEGRAADLTTSDQDGKKLAQLAALAVRAGFDWVFYEDATHVHVSVQR